MAGISHCQIPLLSLFFAAQLVCSPHIAREIRLLEVGSLFSCMIQAVAGVLLYPSLDKSNECVGSTYLDQVRDPFRRPRRAIAECSVFLESERKYKDFDDSNH